MPVTREPGRTLLRCPACGAVTDLSTVGHDWTIRSPGDVVARLMGSIGTEPKEVLEVLVLDRKNHVIVQHRVALGNVGATSIRIGELFTEAIRTLGSSLVLIHNHPSGDPTPSADDLHLTAEAIAAGRLLDIEVLDHIVVARDAWVSLRDRGVTFGR